MKFMKVLLRVVLRTLLIVMLILLGVLIANVQHILSNPRVSDEVFERQPGPDVPTLQTFAADAADDAVILVQVRAYFEANAERLAQVWREDNPTRVAGIFSMYISHISLPYGVTPFPATLAEFARQERAHCGTYTFAQQDIAGALGLTMRTVEFLGEHAWLEILVDDQWEVFDATTNVWINRSTPELLDGVVREYRSFYTPMLDIDRPDARLHLREGFDMPALRVRMPLLGLRYFPPGQRIISEVIAPSA